MDNLPNTCTINHCSYHWLHLLYESSLFGSKVIPSLDVCPFRNDWTLLDCSVCFVLHLDSHRKQSMSSCRVCFPMLGPNICIPRVHDLHPQVLDSRCQSWISTKLTGLSHTTRVLDQTHLLHLSHPLFTWRSHLLFIDGRPRGSSGYWLEGECPKFYPSSLKTVKSWKYFICSAFEEDAFMN